MSIHLSYRRTAVSPHLVIDVAVGEHGVEVLQAVTRGPIVVVLQAFLNGSQVHGRRYDLVIILRKQAISLIAHHQHGLRH